MRSEQIANILYEFHASADITLEDLAELIIEEIPSVVRCKDCKWWKTNYSWNGTEHKVCVIEPYEPVRKPDDYCSRGERKDNV